MNRFKMGDGNQTLSVNLKISEIHSEYFDALWDYYQQDCSGVKSRNDIDESALRLAERIYSSISVQFKVLGLRSYQQVPIVCQFTCIKAYAEALTADFFSFIKYLSILRDLGGFFGTVGSPDMLFFDQFEAKCFNEKGSIPTAAGEISFELQSPNNSDTLEESCVTTAFHITYALNCAPDVHYIISSIDTLEHYHIESVHPL